MQARDRAKAKVLNIINENEELACALQNLSYDKPVNTSTYKLPADSNLVEFIEPHYVSKFASCLVLLHFLNPSTQLRELKVWLEIANHPIEWDHFKENIEKVHRQIKRINLKENLNDKLNDEYAENYKNKLEQRAFAESSLMVFHKQVSESHSKVKARENYLTFKPNAAKLNPNAFLKPRKEVTIVGSQDYKKVKPEEKIYHSPGLKHRRLDLTPTK